MILIKFACEKKTNEEEINETTKENKSMRIISWESHAEEILSVAESMSFACTEYRIRVPNDRNEILFSCSHVERSHFVIPFRSTSLSLIPNFPNSFETFTSNIYTEVIPGEITKCRVTQNVIHRTIFFLPEFFRVYFAVGESCAFDMPIEIPPRLIATNG